MAIFDLHFIFIFVLIWLISTLVFLPIFSKKSPQSIPLPPSPPSLPLIGHFHHLSLPFHRSLQNISSKYGPLLHLRAFHFPIFLVSSPSLAYEIYRREDVNFSNHAVATREDCLIQGPYSFISAPYGDYWKFMKKLLVKELLGPQQLLRSRSLRGEEFESFYVNMIEKAKKGEVANVGEEVKKLANNIVCKMIMGKRCSEENGTAEQVRNLAEKTIRLVMKLTLAEAIRSRFKFVSAFLEREVKHASLRYDELLEKALGEHEKNPNRENRDMMDILLEAYHDENAPYKISRNQIKSFIVDLFIGANDSPVVITKWIMAELINHPNIFKKVREEIENVVGTTRLLEESDLPNLPYLRAVVEEGLRLHSPITIIPKKCEEGCEIGGFYIPKNVTLILNLYGILKDPNAWEGPHEFRPERFLGCVKGKEHNRENALMYIPFGSGRRACPGANLAYIMMGTVIGTMVQCFDWNIEGGNKVNMEETKGLFLDMLHPLMATPVVHFDPLSCTC